MISKVWKILDPKGRKIVPFLTIYISILLGQALVIPLLPIPGGLLLDRYGTQGAKTPVPESAEPGSAILEFKNQSVAYLYSLSMQDFIILLCLAIGVLGLLLGLLRLGEGYLAAWLNRKIMASLREELNEDIIYSRLGYLNSKKKVDLLGRVSTDVEKIQQVLAGGVSTLFKSFPTIFLTIFAMLLVDPLITVIFLSVIPVLYGLAFSLSKPLKNANRRLRESNNSFQEYLLQSYSFFSMTKSLRSEQRILDSLGESNQTALDDFFETEKVASLFYASLIVSKALIRSVVLFVGFYFIMKGRITLGDFFLFFAYLEALIFPFDEISRFNTKWSKTLVSIDRIHSLMEELRMNKETSGPVQDEASNIRLQFENVSFRYAADAALIIEDFSLDLEGPQLIAVVGPSGCGKSTFMSLFNGLYQPEKGKVLLNDTNLADWKRETLRKHVLFMGQESFLLSGSILENIQLANPDCDEDLAWQALKAVNGDQFVKGLPEGIHTVIGEGAHGLSGGQSRRVSLARGFAMPDAKIYLFDEPTAGLDPDSGHKVIESIGQFSTNSLVLFSTHRLDELANVDAVLMFGVNKKPKLVKNKSEIRDIKNRLEALEQ